MIPKVKPWKVTYYWRNHYLFSVIVDTINKRFARWEADNRVRSLKSYAYADRVTVGLIRGTK